jgi:hypothetical protein
MEGGDGSRNVIVEASGGRPYLANNVLVGAALEANCEARRLATPRSKRTLKRQAFKCPETSLVISNIETLFLPLNTGLSLSSALI